MLTFPADSMNGASTKSKQPSWESGMTPKDFRIWRAEMGLKSQKAAADALGYSREHVSRLENGYFGEYVPWQTAMLCAALYYRIKPWPDCYVLGRDPETPEAPAPRVVPAKSRGSTRKKAASDPAQSAKRKTRKKKTTRKRRS